MEHWRTNCDYSVLQTLEQLKRAKEKTHYFTDGFEIVLDSKTINLLFERLRFNLSLEEILLNCRILAKFLLGKNSGFPLSLKPISVKELFETEEVKQKILTMSHRELGTNKSTLWYQKKRLNNTNSLRIYNNTKHHFS